MLPSVTALDALQCPFRSVFKYVKLPSSAFDFLVVLLIKQFQREFEFASTHASFYDVKDIVQLFYFRPEAQMEEWLVLRSSSNALLESVEMEIETIEKFYPGLSCQNKDKSVQAAQASVVNVLATFKVSELLPDMTHIACVNCQKSDAFVRISSWTK